MKIVTLGVKELVTNYGEGWGYKIGGGGGGGVGGGGGSTL